ncbi:MAG: hypothetical protein WBA74_20275 [Cyclobacteriaceae bacterium]
MTKQQREKLLYLINQSKIENAIGRLMESDFLDIDKKELDEISFQYQQLQKNRLNDMHSAEQDDRQQNEIVGRLIEFVKRSEFKTLSVKTKFWKSKIIIWLGIIGSLASIIGLWYVFFPPGTTVKTITILVHGKNGRDELVLPNRGKVYLIYGDAKIPEQINDEGEATVLVFI